MKSITNVISAYLKVKGHSCVTSDSGKDGLRLIEKKKFDVILLDISMPEFSGFDVIDDLGNGELKKHKIIAMSAVNLTSTETDRILEKGVRWFLRKPIHLNELLDVIESVHHAN